MALASMIGASMGILNPWNLSFIIKKSKVPVIVDVDVVTTSDAAIAMELACDCMLMNTAIAGTQHTVRILRRAVPEACTICIMARQKRPSV